MMIVYAIIKIPYLLLKINHDSLCHYQDTLFIIKNK